MSENFRIRRLRARETIAELLKENKIDPSKFQDDYAKNLFLKSWDNEDVRNLIVIMSKHSPESIRIKVTRLYKEIKKFPARTKFKHEVITNGEKEVMLKRYDV